VGHGLCPINVSQRFIARAFARRSEIVRSVRRAGVSFFRKVKSRFKRTVTRAGVGPHMARSEISMRTVEERLVSDHNKSGLSVIPSSALRVSFFQKSPRRDKTAEGHECSPQSRRKWEVENTSVRTYCRQPKSHCPTVCLRRARVITKYMNIRVKFARMRTVSAPSEAATDSCS
jgi:hypothetical protein